MNSSVTISCCRLPGVWYGIHAKKMSLVLFFSAVGGVKEESSQAGPVSHVKVCLWCTAFSIFSQTCVGQPAW